MEVVRCPGPAFDRIEPVAGGICFESAARSREPAGILTALRTCAEANRRLPWEGELIAYGIQHSKEFTGYALTETLSVPLRYRCVTTGSN